VLRTLKAAELPRLLSREINLSSNVGGGLPPTSLCRSYGDQGFHIAGGCYKHFAPTELNLGRTACPEISEKQ